MKFSIVTPSFNHAKYIETTIKSVLENSYQDVEYIIMDGGSTDNTKEVVNKYIKRIKKFISEKDEGQADAINKGFKYADGDIYAYINSDDYYFPYTFEKVARIFKDNPKIDIVYGDCVFVTESEQFLRYFTEVEPFDEYRLRTCTDFIMQPTTFWRKEAFEKMNGFNKDLHYGFDWDLWARLAAAKMNFHYLQLPLATNREFETTKTASGSYKRLLELYDIVESNKMGKVPHAIYGYAYDTILKDMEAGHLKEFLLRTMRHLSTENIEYNRENCENKKLYGLHPHLPAINSEARVSLPWYKKQAKSIHFRLVPFTGKFAANQKAVVHLNENLVHEVELSESDGELVFISVPEQLQTSNHFDIDIEIENAKKHAACNLEEITISESEIPDIIIDANFSIEIHGKNIQKTFSMAEFLGIGAIELKLPMLMFRLDHDIFTNIESVNVYTKNKFAILLTPMDEVDSSYSRLSISSKIVPLTFNLERINTKTYMVKLSNITTELCPDLLIKDIINNNAFIEPKLDHIFSSLPKTISENDVQESLCECVKLYLDTGNGMSEETAIVKKCHQINSKLRFDLSKVSNLKRFRIDITEQLGMVRLNNCTGTSRAGEDINLLGEEDLSNIPIQRRNIHIFDHNDPWCEYNNSQDLISIEIDVDFLHQSHQVIDTLIQKLYLEC